MSDFPPPMRRRSRSEIETQRRSLHEERNDDRDDDDDEDNGGFRRRVVSFTCPAGVSLTYLRHRDEDICAAHLDLQKSESGEDAPDGLFRKADTSREEKGGSGNVGGFRRRLKSFSIGLSLSPGSSTHDVRTGSHEAAAGALAAGALVGGRMVSSLVRQSLLQAAWPLSVSLEDIEAHQQQGKQQHER